MSVRLILVTEIISPYRIPVFNSLAKNPDIDLHVLFLAETDPTERDWHVYKDEIKFSYEVLRSTRRRVAGKSFLLSRGLKTAVSRAKPDVIVCGGYNYLAYWQLMHAALATGVPFLLWMESTAKDRRSHRWFAESAKRWFVRRCHGVVVPGTASARYARSFGVPDEKIFLAPNAVDNKLFAQRAHAARENEDETRRLLSLPARFFLFVGRLVAEKGVFELLEAYGNLGAEVRSKVGLVFAGDGVARKELVRRVAEMELRHVSLPGFFQRDQLAPLYAMADVLVLPTYSDTWGLVVNEAMACGLPIVVTEVAGCAEDLVVDGKNGRIVPVKDVARLSDAMNSIVSDERSRASMGECSREMIEAYSPADCAAGLAAAALQIAMQGTSG